MAAVVNSLVEALLELQWTYWLQRHYEQRAALLNQLIAYSALGLPIARADRLDVLGITVSWQDLEKAGLVSLRPTGNVPLMLIRCGRAAMLLMRAPMDT